MTNELCGDEKDAVVIMNVIPRTFADGIVHPHEKKRRVANGHIVSIEYGAALHEWGALSTRLLDAGAKIISWNINQDLPDGGFIQDNGYILWDFVDKHWKFIGLRMGTPARRAEERAVLVSATEHFEDVLPWDGPGCIEGGDIYPSVLLEGTPTVFVGLRTDVDSGISVRTDGAGLERFTEIVRAMGYDVVTVPFWDTLHLTSIGSFIGSDPGGIPTVLIDATRCDVRAFQEHGVRVIDLPPDAHADAWGVNAIRINDSLIVQKGYASIEALLRSEGFEDLTFVPWTQLRMVDGSLTCCCIIQTMPSGWNKGMALEFR